MAPQISLARIDDAPVLDHVLADAFFDDPLNDWLLPNERRRHGQGIGSALVRAGLAEADRARVPTFLGTSNPRNLPLYERLGFVVSEEFDAWPVHVWAMLREPESG